MFVSGSHQYDIYQVCQHKRCFPGDFSTRVTRWEEEVTFIFLSPIGTSMHYITKTKYVRIIVPSIVNDTTKQTFIFKYKSVMIYFLLKLHLTEVSTVSRRTQTERICCAFTLLWLQALGFLEYTQLKISSLLKPNTTLKTLTRYSSQYKNKIEHLDSGFRVV